MNGTPTETVYAQDTDEENYRVADATETLDEFAENVAEGDYLAVVYSTPSNGSSLQRVMGHVEEVERLDGDLDDLRFPVEDGTGDGPTGEEDATAYLHVNAETGDYYFTDGRSGEVPADGWTVEKWAWTPANAVEA